MRICREQVFPAVIIEVKQPQAPAAELMGQRADAAAIGPVSKSVLALIAKQRKSFAGECGKDDIRPAVISVVAKISPHAGNRAPVIGKGCTYLQRHLGEFTVSEIVTKKIVLLVVGDENVCHAVAIVIRERHTHSFTNLCRDARHDRHVLERAVSTIVVKRIWQTLEKSRMAVSANVVSRVAAEG